LSRHSLLGYCVQCHCKLSVTNYQNKIFVFAVALTDTQAKIPLALLPPTYHGHNLVGNVSPHFFRRGRHDMLYPPHFFLLGFVFGEVSKLNVTFVTFCVKSFWC